MSLLPRTYHLILNLFSVYFLEYCIITAFAQTMSQKIKNEQGGGGSLRDREYFDILNFCY